MPIVPSETTVIIGGVAAGVGDQNLLAVIACGAVGAFLGDNTAYLIGSRMSGWIQRQAAKKPKRQLRLDWAAEQIRVRGGLLLITARFIPGGRTALTLSSGITHQPRRGSSAGRRSPPASGPRTRRCSATSAARRSRTTTPRRSSSRSRAAIGITVVIEVVRHFRAKHR